jgi:hypothetical protein
MVSDMQDVESKDREKHQITGDHGELSASLIPHVGADHFQHRQLIEPPACKGLD